MNKAPKDGNTSLPRRPGDYQHRTVVGGLRGLTRKYLPRNKQVLFAATMRGQDRTYRTKIRFDDYKGKTTPEARSEAIKAETPNGDNIWIDSPNLNKNPVDIACTCDDFRFNFEAQLFKKGKHLLNKHKGDNSGKKATKYEPYQRVTDPLRRPSRPENPNPDGRDFKNPDNILYKKGF